ncbi:dimethylsulfonioproprionate lyase family protein [Aestuariivirga sp.]|uniref:dimethylsulfonioproprionate lyase family protein n=1 Tax=Aestuariivirga sp. TaxID=2650926 RepID=UPI003018FFA2
MRDSNLQQILDLSQRVIAASGQARAVAAAMKVFGRLAAQEGARGAEAAERLPVCQHTVEAALADLAARPSPLPELATAFGAAEGGLRWNRRKTARSTDEPFYSSHANAMLIGPGGLEERADLEVGVTVMPAHTVYPDHHHPPEEVYIALSAGEWWNAAMDWTEPGPGGIIYNPPGILHAMRSGDGPLLALWFLPVD